MKEKKKMEFSKKLIIATGLIFILSLCEIGWLAYMDVDVSDFAEYQILAVGGVFAAAIGFYLNKAKIENLSKGKIKYVLIKMKLELKIKKLVPEEVFEKIEKAFDKVINLIEDATDEALEEAINEEIEVEID